MRSLLIILLSFCSAFLCAEDTYRLELASEITAGELYVFVQSGRAMDNVIKDGALSTTDTYLAEHLLGNESYVWRVEAAGKGFRLKNMSFATKNCLSNVSNSTSLKFDSSTLCTLWGFRYNDDDKTWTIYNASDTGRMLAFVSSTDFRYRSYIGSSDLYPHRLTAYRLVREDSENIARVRTDRMPATSYDLSGKMVRKDFGRGVVVRFGRKFIE